MTRNETPLLTMRCKGYRFVDFKVPAATEAAVKPLKAQGIQAQMAKTVQYNPTHSVRKN